MLSSNAMNELNSWLATLSPPLSMKANPDAMDREIELIAQTMERAGATTVEQVKSVFHEIKSTAETRSWPTAREINAAVSKLRGSREGVGVGDINNLTYDERGLLHEKVLPTARKWLDVPGLRSHGISTLEFWGQETPKP